MVFLSQLIKMMLLGAWMSKGNKKLRLLQQNQSLTEAAPLMKPQKRSSISAKAMQ
jgi:hypothetical protein